MLEAIAADAARDASLDVTVLIDESMLDRREQTAAIRKPEPQVSLQAELNKSRKPEPQAERAFDGPSTPGIFLNSPLGLRLGLPCGVGAPHTSAPACPSAAVRRLPVQRGREIDTLIAEARGADWTLIVAPETDGILAARVSAVRAAGGRVLAPHEAFLAIASDKQATIDCLAAAGVAVPAGRSLAPLEAPPAGFRLPAVRKHRGSAGGDGLGILRSANVATSRAASRVESFVAGTPVGVAVLCGPGGLWPMPPMRQRFSEEDFPRYLGSEPWNDRPGTERARRLAERAVTATVRAAASRDAAAGTVLGWVGVDMILGARDDGVEDRVLEINPRLTTSFLGLSAAQEESVVATMIAIAEGRGGRSGFDWKPGIAFSLD